MVQMKEPNSTFNSTFIEKDQPSHKLQRMEAMKRTDSHISPPIPRGTATGVRDLPGYPLYPDTEDIFRKSREEHNINPEDTSQKKESDERHEAGGKKEKHRPEDMSGSDLDVPGSELDDQQESVGSEDEENNFYSLGGDSHDD